MIEVKEDTDTRLDIFLANNLGVSRSKVQKLVKEGLVTVNLKEVSSSYQVKLNDKIDIKDDLNYEAKVEAENIFLDVIFEDDDLMIINKKSGMVVHPAPGHYSKTLVNALLYRNISCGDNLRPGIVHRLDKDTSGLMIVAKNEEMLEKLSKMISEKKVERKYLAIVDGVIKHETGEIDAPIGRDISNRQKMAVSDINSKEAITHFKVLERFNKNTLIECVLDTGRTHQIRVHLAQIGYPIIGDTTYSSGKNKWGIEGQCLHAKTLEFKHPTTGKLIHLEAELPQYFKDILNSMEV